MPTPAPLGRARSALFATAACLGLTASELPAQDVTVRVADWAAMPFSGDLTNTGTSLSGNPVYMSRVNFLRPEPGAAGRVWICDLNGHLYILDTAGDPATRTAALLAQARNRAPYLDFNGQSSTSSSGERVNVPDAAGTSTSQAQPNGLFANFTKASGYANGLVTFQFDPEDDRKWDAFLLDEDDLEPRPDEFVPL